jgi:hypothetical protein
MTGRVFGWLGIRNGVGLVETGTDGSSRSVDVMAIDCLGELGDIADLGLTRASSLWLWSNRKSSHPRAGTMRSEGRNAELAPSPAKSRIAALTRSPLCSIRSRSGCPASTAPAAAGQRLVSGGRRIAARRPNSIRSERSFPPACLTAPPPVYSNTFCRSMRGLDPETLRAHTLKVSEELRDAATAEPATATAAITLTS